MSETMTIQPLWQYNLDGMHLIEASAGTGKTYTIMNLYLRFVLEKGCTVNQILVVTFTEAATKELKERIRGNLNDTLQWLMRLDESELAAALESSAVNEKITARFLAEKAESGDFELIKAETALNLRRAVISFDEAAIFTIHGFCQRMLNENAFESGMLFDTELLTDQSDLIQEAVDDFWRKTLYARSRAEVEILQESSFNREMLKTLAEEALKNPQLRLAVQSHGAQAALSDQLARIEQLQTQIEAILAETKASQAKVHHHLFSEAGKAAFRRHLYPNEKPVTGSAATYKQENFEKYFSQLQEAVASFPTGNKTALERYQAGKIESKLLKSFKADFQPHELSLLLEKELVPAYGQIQQLEKEKAALFEVISQQLVNQLKTDFLIQLATIIQRKKETLNVMTFDDLLQNLQKALKNPQSGELYKQLIRAKYQVALIDEFQDTDPIQYDIFSTLFGAESGATFFMIGDPKQSIYKFRGADIFAYLDANAQVRDPQNRHGLDTNYRSESGMINAVNHYFSAANNPFLAEAIQFVNVKTGGLADRKARLVSPTHSPQAPLQFCWLENEYVPDALLNAPAAIRRISEHIADEITRLTDGSLYFENADSGDQQAVQPGDIAILVNSHRQAGLMQKVLSKRGIPSVLQSAGNLFTALEVREFIHVLHAISNPHERAIRTALATEAFALKADEIAALDDRAFMRWYDFFNRCRELWQNRGFMRMFRELSQLDLEPQTQGDAKTTQIPGSTADGHAGGLRTRLVGRPFGERKLTNLLHLSEVLHREETTEQFSPDALITWFNRRLSENTVDDEEHLQRLESDAKAVKFLTIHKSKGLEFPIVFCPFLWNRKFTPRSSKSDFLYYDETERARFYDIGSNEREAHLLAMKKETLQEDLRLLYVALTRARNRCYLHWGAINQSQSSPLMYLAEQPGDLDAYLNEPTKNCQFSLITKDGEITDSVPERLKNLAENSANTIGFRVVRRPSEPLTFTAQSSEFAEAELTARDFTAELSESSGIGSFTSLTRFASHKSTAPIVDRSEGRDVDEIEVEMPKIAPDHAKNPEIFLHLRGGADLGTAVHEIFEAIDFTRPELNLAEVVDLKLKRYGLVQGKTEMAKIDDLALKSAIVGKMVKNTLNAQITLPDETVCQLKDVKNFDRLVELKFYFRLKELSPGRLAEIFTRDGHGELARAFAQQLSHLKFDLKQGAITGAIDLTFQHADRFYILDWKTTTCGTDLANDYTPERLKQSMMDHHYILQYHIYVAAIHLYLSQRLADYDYDRDFGGIIYAYLRGISPEFPENGFFTERPPKALIETICEEVIGERCHV